MKELIELFQSHDVEFLVVGAHALDFHGRGRYTQDLDLFLRRTDDNVKRVRRALDEFGFNITDDAEARLASTPRGMIVLGKKPNQVDLLNFLDGVDFESAWERRINGELSEVNVPFIGLADYVATKRASGRPKDMWDLAFLEEQLGSLPDEPAT